MNDWVAIISESFEELGAGWMDRYGEASPKAAMVVSGDIPHADVDEFSKLCWTRAAQHRRAAVHDKEEERPQVG